jgi:hypothetical protein
LFIIRGVLDLIGSTLKENTNQSNPIQLAWGVFVVLNLTNDFVTVKKTNEFVTFYIFTLLIETNI